MSSKSLNKVMLIGNVTRDPELRYTPQGNAVATFGLATNRSWKTEGGEVREEAEFHRLVAWNKLAELCSQLCTKGRKIYVEGRLQTRTFTGSDNIQHTITEIVIEDMLLLDSRMGQGGYAGGSFQRPPATEAPVKEVEQDVAAEVPAGEAGAPTANVGAATTAPTDDQSGKKGKKKKEEEAKEEVNVDDIPF